MEQLPTWADCLRAPPPPCSACVVLEVTVLRRLVLLVVVSARLIAGCRGLDLNTTVHSSTTYLLCSPVTRLHVHVYLLYTTNPLHTTDSPAEAIAWNGPDWCAIRVLPLNIDPLSLSAHRVTQPEHVRRWSHARPATTTAVISVALARRATALLPACRQRE